METIMARKLADTLKYFINSIEPLEEEKNEVQEKIKIAYSDAKVAKLDTKALKQLIKERKLKKEEMEEHNSLLDLYRNALKIVS